MATLPAAAQQAAHSRWLAAVLLLSFAFFAGTLFNGFVYDDDVAVLGNPFIQNFRHVGRMFTASVFSFQGEDGASNYYRPLFNLAFLAVHTMFGDLPFGYHLLNILLHVAIVGLVYAVARELFRDKALALLSAALFAVHPVHAEVVAWISCIADLEMALFYLLSFLCFLRLDDAAGPRARWLTFGMLAFFTLALLSKEPAITLPVTAMLYEFLCRRRSRQIPLRTSVLRVFGLWLVAAGYFALRLGLLGSAIPMLRHPDVTWLRVPLCALALLAEYAGKLFWPWPLSIAYPFHASTSAGEPRVLAGLFVLLAAVALILFLARRSRRLAFALLWIFLLLAPALNARWMGTYVFAERNLYLASASFSWLFAAAILWLWRHAESSLPRRAALMATCATLALLAVGAITMRNRDFKDNGTLYSRTLALHSDAALIRSNFGVWQWTRGRRDEAQREWRRALESDPHSFIALSNLGMALLEEERYTEAEETLQRALVVRPRFSSPHFHLAELYAAQHRSADAEREFLRALELNPWSTATQNSFAQFCLEAGRLDEAAAHFRESEESIPNENAWAGLAEVYSRRNDFAQAERAWQEVLRLNHFHVRAHFALGKIYLSAGRFAEAKQEFRSGLLTDPHNEAALAALRDLAARSPGNQ